jgi:hypothetical protein
MYWEYGTFADCSLPTCKLCFRDDEKTRIKALIICSKPQACQGIELSHPGALASQTALSESSSWHVQMCKCICIVYPFGNLEDPKFSPTNNLKHTKIYRGTKTAIILKYTYQSILSCDIVICVLF